MKMKKQYNPLLIILFTWLITSVTYANDDPGFPIGPGTDPGNPPPQPPASPIDMWIYPTLLIGFYFAFRIIYYKKRKASLK